ncbi:MAG: FAD-binding protein, partial [Proteiniclasticum sp.]|nr:FAD-binding protein [Proteiniclasticum sp.]
MKKLGKKVTAALLLLLSISFAACGTKEPAAPETPETPSTIGEGLFTPGTYEGTAKGYHGDITLTVTVDENNILEIKSEHTETEGLGDKAVATLTEAALEKASLSMDLVSGATYSSQGFLAALEAALVKAGADVEKLKIKETVEVEKKDQEFDTEVAIIGGGGAGLAAAVSAHQNGAKVLLVEKMPNIGGNTIISGSAFNAVDPKRQSAQGIEDSVEKHFQQTYEGGDKQGDPEL